jgi:hypothetical protein
MIFANSSTPKECKDIWKAFRQGTTIYAAAWLTELHEPCGGIRLAVGKGQSKTGLKMPQRDLRALSGWAPAIKFECESYILGVAKYRVAQ